MRLLAAPAFATEYPVKRAAVVAHRLAVHDLPYPAAPSCHDVMVCACLWLWACRHVTAGGCTDHDHHRLTPTDQVYDSSKRGRIGRAGTRQQSDFTAIPHQHHRATAVMYGSGKHRQASVRADSSANPTPHVSLLACLSVLPIHRLSCLLSPCLPGSLSAFLSIYGLVGTPPLRVACHPPSYSAGLARLVPI